MDLESSDIIGTLPHMLGSRLKRLGEQMQSDAILVAHEQGLPVQPGQYPILLALMGGQPMTIGDLANTLKVSQPAVTKQVRRMAIAELVEVRTNQADKRVRSVSLTPTGVHVLTISKLRVWPAVEAAVREVTSDLSGPFIESLTLLEKRLKQRPLSERAKSLRASSIAAAKMSDLPDVVALMNRAYRGNSSHTGWTTEQQYIDGDRTTLADLQDDLSARPKAVLLILRIGSSVAGCVWVEPLDGGTYYLGSLAIEPEVQNAKLGRELLTAAENWIIAAGGTKIRLRVLNTRHELIAWYVRRGYLETGQVEPFPYGDDRLGRPKRHDLEFVILEKSVTAAE
jgi:DNA-binding MarR family transcriptional regulator/ribosomal protein S18 acetylase RimI-like enzyme